MIYPTDGAVLIISPSAIVKGTKHPNAAKLFMEFLIRSRPSEIDVKHFTVPMRPEVQAAPGAQAVDQVKTPADRRARSTRASPR